MATVVVALLGLLVLLGAGPGECRGYEGHGMQHGMRHGTDHGTDQAPHHGTDHREAAAAHCAPGDAAQAGCCAGPADGYAAALGQARPEQEQPGDPTLDTTSVTTRPRSPETVVADLPPPRPGGGRHTLTDICVSRT